MPDNTAAPQDQMLQTPEEEAREVEALILKGRRAHAVSGILTVVGLVLLVAAILYYKRFDYAHQGRTPTPFPDYLSQLVENQVKMDRITYGARGQSEVPTWPDVLYEKLRLDIYLVSGVMLLLALVFIHIVRATTHRNDLLVYRALGREVEKLRRRVRELEGKGSSTSAPPPAKETPPGEQTPPAAEPGGSGAPPSPEA